MYPGTYARLSPDRPAVVMSDTGETLTYAQLDERSIRLSRYLHEQGLRRGDNVALLAGNSPRYSEVYWAAIRSGLYITAINHNLKPAEIAYIVNDCGAKVLIVSGAKADLARAIADETPAVLARLAFDGDVEGHGDYESALAAAGTVALEDDRAGSDMLYSSGTTGLPKAVKAPLDDRRVGDPDEPHVALFGEMYGFDGDTVYLCPAPLYHSAPLRFAGFVHARGGTVVVMPGFEPFDALAAIERHRVTHSQWVPTMFVRMLKLPPERRDRFDLSTHRVAVHAAAPCPTEVKRAMFDWWGPILHEYYAATEGNGITLVGPQEWLERPGTVGRAGLGVLHVCEDDGRELPTGEIGLVYFERDEAVFSYHNDPEKTAGAQHPSHPHWTTTGDVGYLDRDGYLFLTDRKAFMIISGGVNIYPQEIENALTMHPKVHDIAVIGVPDAEMGEQVMAFVAPSANVLPGAELERELIGFVRERIAHYKAPRGVEFVDELPRTPTGKLQKNRLRARFTD
ncbi:acyl-CoA synthetase [Amycolatopsis antarctica]|uniref:Acyl-CoA synthetase n=1 Tax=Amycolatopsis antarctica TaxID=1854586 RepID=A0A263D057_9PSEU|nr:acyl-CoA synthetase [Amycolatopsis antarctica]OZM71820.1 acyl-CoA synthetase [Amycolatopsis antarctica]